jgi:hypothetical protein
MIWFSIVNYLKERKHLPICLKFLILKYVAFLAIVSRSKNNRKEQKKNHLDETLLTSKYI